MSIKKGNRIIAGAPLEAVWGNISGDITDQADLQAALAEKVGVNSPAFTGTPTAPTPPTGSYDDRIATTSYVQQAIESVDGLPSQSGHNGQFLTTDGSNASWATVNALPSQTSQAGKYLTTNGTTASWSTIPNEIPSQSGQSGKYLTTNGSTVSWGSFDDSNLVHKTGNENIDGNKTFLSNVQIKNIYPSLVLVDTNMTIGQYSATQNECKLIAQDVNKRRLSEIRTFVDPDGSSVLNIGVSTKNASDEEVYRTILSAKVSPENVGTINTNTPTEDTTSSTQIDTVGARNTKLQNYQLTLVSGTNIKTINNTTILGSGNIDTHELPTQTGNNGKFLTTNGTAVSWATVDAFPTQAGNTGKFLTTDGSTVSWADTPSSLPSQSGQSGKFLTTNGSAASWASLPTYSSGTGITVSGTTINHSNSVTAGTAGTSSATSGSSLAVPYVTYDAQGHITASGTHTHTVTGFLTSNDIDQTYSGTSTNAQSGVAVKSAIDAAVASVYKPAGSVAFANKPTLSSSIEGNVYNITDDFTTTSDFVEGTGHNYPAGTNIVCINTASSGQTAVYKWDVLAGFVDLSGYVTKDGGSAQQTIQLTSGTGTTAFGVKSRSTASYISFSGTGGWLGSYGVTSAKEPTFYNGSSYTLAYNIGTGSANGTISANGSDVAVKGLGSAAYTSSSDYQPTLVSGTNIKTINNTTILGSGNIDTHELPSQSGQSGKYLTTNGSVVSWATVDALPSQSGQSGKYLTTNGTSASWATISQMTATYDSTNERITWV